MLSVEKTGPELHDTYVASNSNQHEKPSGSFNNPLLSGMATDSTTLNSANFALGIDCPAAPEHSDIPKNVAPAGNSSCFAHPSALLLGTNQINPVSIPPQIGDLQELPRIPVRSTSNNTAYATHVPLHKSTTGVTLPQNTPLVLSGQGNFSTKSSSESNQVN